ncbi:hypothetical protein F5Y12DRAFT_794047 [Xylaria sp. FL1777]|nr:hypothetical protein F5Y12DRAFT_794047 [Xylaria sp. FL1777]
MGFLHPILHPQRHPGLARARLQIIAIYFLMIDAIVNTIVLCFSFRSSDRNSSSRNSIQAFAIARSVYLTLFLAAWFSLRLRITWIERRAILRASAMRNWVRRLPSFVSQRLRGMFTSKWSNARSHIDEVHHLGTAYQPTSTFTNYQCELGTPDEKCHVPTGRADCPAEKDRLPSAQSFQVTQVHMSNDNNLPLQSTHSRLSSGPSQSKDQQAARRFPILDTDYVYSEIELSAGDEERLVGTETLKDPFEDHYRELGEEEKEKKKEKVHYGPGAGHYVQYSAVDAQHDEDVRAAIVEQARRHPARHLATSRELLHTHLRKEDTPRPGGT